MMDLAIAIAVLVGSVGILGILIGITIGKESKKVEVDVEEIEEDLNAILPKRTSKKVRNELISYILYLLYKGDED